MTSFFALVVGFHVHLITRLRSSGKRAKETVPIPQLNVAAASVRSGTVVLLPRSTIQ